MAEREAGSPGGGDGGEALLDTEFVAEMVGTYGPEMMEELAASLGEEAGELLAALSRAASAGDAIEAARLLHSLRGAALGVGCAALGAEVGELEQRARAGRVPPAAALSEIAERLETSLEALRRLSRAHAA
jgi:HPt (histidine-containing phosphotransfer) domain-containing protein